MRQSPPSKGASDNGFERVKTDGEIKETHLFPVKLIPFILGEKGAKLNEIKSRSNAVIHVTATGTLVIGDKRKVTMSGDRESIDKAKEEIDKALKEVEVEYENFNEEFSVSAECQIVLEKKDDQGWNHVDRIKSKHEVVVRIRTCPSDETLVDICLTGALHNIRDAKEDIIAVLGPNLYRIPDSHSAPDLIDIGPLRTENPTSEGGFKRTRDKDGKIVEVLRFPADRMGLIVGVKGAAAKEIEANTGVQLSIADKGDVVDGDKREVTLRGDERNISLAKGKIDSLFRAKGVVFDNFKEAISIPVDLAHELISSEDETDPNFHIHGATLKRLSIQSSEGALDYILTGELDHIRKAKAFIDLKGQRSKRLNSPSIASKLAEGPDQKPTRGIKREMEDVSYQNQNKQRYVYFLPFLSLKL